MPTKRQIENAHIRGAHLALAYTNSLTWREISDLFPTVPPGTMKHNMQRAKRSCLKAGITAPSLSQLLLHAEEAPRGGAEARLMYPVGSAVSETLKERAMHYEGRKEVGLKRIVEETCAATGVDVALSTAVRILKEHHGIQRRGPNRKRRVVGEVAVGEREKGAQRAAVRGRLDGHLSAQEQGIMDGDTTRVSHQATNQQRTPDDDHTSNHDTGLRKDSTSADPHSAAQDYMHTNHPHVAGDGDSDPAVQQNRIFQFTPSNHFPTHDPSVMRDPYQSNNHNENHDISFSNYIDPNLDSEQEGRHQIS